MFQADLVDEPGPGIESDPVEATSDDHISDESSASRLTSNQLSSVDARKRKAIEIPMV